MLTRKPVTKDSGDLGEIESLYLRSFPEKERRPFEDLIGADAGYVETTALYDKDLLVGFACLIQAGDIAHIIYFAVEEALRGRGYGSEALREIAREKAGSRIMVDIERPDSRAGNSAQRERRKRFYLRNGYAETGIRYRWHREDYEILVSGGTLSFEEYKAFWRCIARHGRNAVGL